VRIIETPLATKVSAIMTEKDKKHKHSGKSSDEFLDSRKILRDIELDKGQVVLDAGPYHFGQVIKKESKGT
jgi:hypothetical protein